MVKNRVKELEEQVTTLTVELLACKEKIAAAEEVASFFQEDETTTWSAFQLLCALRGVEFDNADDDLYNAVLRWDGPEWDEYFATKEAEQ